MTKQFLREVEKLKKMILSLCGSVQERVQEAVRAFHEGDEALAEKIIVSDREIDLQEIEVEEECLKVLALHQPVAHDLRLVIAVLKINNDLERIGDLAVNIAHRAASLANTQSTEAPSNLPAESEKVERMLEKSIEAFLNLDVTAAREVMASDDEIDELNRQNHMLTLAEIKKDPGSSDSLLLRLSVSRHLERIADHATNIAEDVVYLVEGDIVRHQL